MSMKRKAMYASLSLLTVGGVLTWLYAEQLDSEHESLLANQVEVVKAARNISPRTPLTKDRITTEKVPRKFLPPNPLLESELNIYLGTPLMKNVEEGAMILTTDFSVEGIDSAAMRSFDLPMVIKTANLGLESDSPKDVSQKALQLVAERGGYIVSSELLVNHESETQRFEMVARVPAVEFESVVLEMREIGTPTSEWVRGAGVSEEVSELEAKIGNRKKLVEGLERVAEKAHDREKPAGIQILHGDGTKTIHPVENDDSDAVDVERELAEVRDDVAEMETEISQLHGNVALSTIELTIDLPRPEQPAPPEPPTFGERLSDTFMDSLGIVESVAFFGLRCVAALLPILLFLSPALIAGGLWYRRRRRVEATGE